MTQSGEGGEKTLFSVTFKIFKNVGGGGVKPPPSRPSPSAGPVSGIC